MLHGVHCDRYQTLQPGREQAPIESIIEYTNIGCMEYTVIDSKPSNQAESKYL